MRLLQLRLYGPAIAARRLPSPFKVSSFAKMGERQMKSRASDGDPTNNLTSSIFDEGDFPALSDTTVNSKHLSKKNIRIGLGGSASPSQQKPKEVQTNHTIKVEVADKNCTATSTAHHEGGDQSVKSLTISPSTLPGSQEMNIDLMQVEEKQIGSSMFITRKQMNDMDFPERFGKKWTPKPKPKLAQKLSWETSHKHRGFSKGGIKNHLNETKDESFNICFPSRIRESKCGQVLRPGMVLFKHYIPISQQVGIVNKCQELGCGSGGFYQPGYKNGAKFRLHMMCLGLDWDPQTRKYGKSRIHDNAEPPAIPIEFSSLVGSVLNDSHDLIKREMKVVDVETVLPTMSPDLCIVNFYNENGRLGLHQDCDESRGSLDKGLPVVSISIGDSAEFLYGDNRDVDKAECVLLESGDVLIFGGDSRLVFHGVENIIKKTAPLALVQETGLRPGRLNLTFRKY